MAIFSQVDTQFFAGYFSGNTRFHGQSILGDMIDGKRTAQCKAVHEPPMMSHYVRHLNGEVGLGISPLRDDGTCLFGVLDIDSCAFALDYIVKAITDYDLPLLPCRSKSNKLHLYVFFSEPTLAKDVQELLQWYRTALSLDAKTEIFPKQTVATLTSFPSWINLPYFGETRQALAPFELSLTEALSRITLIRKTIQEHNSFLSGQLWYTAPPCVLSGVLLRHLQAGGRNTWLFAYGVFLSFQGRPVLDALLEINEQFDSPLEEKEVWNIAESLGKKTYFYPCSDLSGCNKAFCRTQKHGMNYKLSTGISYGQLTQVLTDPPYYEWEVNNQTLVFYSETDIMSQHQFRNLCLRQLHIVPRPVPPAHWADILNKACENIVSRDVVTEEDVSIGAMFNAAVKSFFVSARLSPDIRDVAFDKIVDTPDGTLFSGQSLLTYIRDVKGVKNFSTQEVRRRLISDFAAIPPSANCKWWCYQGLHLPPLKTAADVNIDESNDETEEINLDEQLY